MQLSSWKKIMCLCTENVPHVYPSGKVFVHPSTIIMCTPWKSSSRRPGPYDFNMYIHALVERAYMPCPEYSNLIAVRSLWPYSLHALWLSWFMYMYVYSTITTTTMSCKLMQILNIVIIPGKTLFCSSRCPQREVPTATCTCSYVKVHLH